MADVFEHLLDNKEKRKWAEKKRRASRDRAIAYHEAGHAVAAFALDIPVLYATIVPDGENEGHVQFADQEVSVQDVATVALAGPAAQEHGQRRKGPNASDYLTDVMNALACLREVLPEGEATRWGRYLEQRAKDIVTSEAYWPAVEAVAKELVQHRKLTGKQVDECIKNSAIMENLYVEITDYEWFQFLSAQPCVLDDEVGGLGQITPGKLSNPATIEA